MSARSAVIQLVPDSGTADFSLEVACLPGPLEWRGIPLLHLADALGDPQAERPELLEESEYHYHLRPDGPPVVLEPTELFSPSSADAREGRLRTGTSTGIVEIRALSLAGEELGRGEIEVRSRKLNYLSEYRFMLQRIADEAAELVQLQFAPSLLRAFRPEGVGDAQTLYQRFAFVEAFVGSDEFEDALQLITRRPHHEYRAVVERIRGGQGVRSSPVLHRQLVRAGPRQPLPPGRAIANVTSIPRSLDRVTHFETYDTTPNRFVKAALTRWRDLAVEVQRALEGQSTSAGKRGRREAMALGERLELLLKQPLFAEVRELAEFPAGNTVLHGRAGYHEITRAYLQGEAAALIDWEGGEEVFGAGQRDVATLYEYWVFLELVRIVDELPYFDLDRASLFEVSADQLRLRLRQGRQAVVRGSGRHRGHRLDLELWFNRSFRAGTESWTETVRPDCSIKLTRIRGGVPKDVTWLHFDAKYRIDRYVEVFREPQPDGLDELPSRVEAAPLSEDILKMHAYRDAVERSAGAYILYPGRDEAPTRRSRYHEVLPGLGAFVLRPDLDGKAASSGAGSLQSFLVDVVDHVAARGTDHERSRYWHDRTYTEQVGRKTGSTPTELPPADAKVLLGFVKSPAHQAWIERTHLYNLRADDRRGSIGLDSPALNAEIVCFYTTAGDELQLFTTSGAFYLRTADELRQLGYPNPRGRLYCCLELKGELDLRSSIRSPREIRHLARSGHREDVLGAPAVVSWLDILP